MGGSENSATLASARCTGVKPRPAEGRGVRSPSREDGALLCVPPAGDAGPARAPLETDPTRVPEDAGHHCSFGRSVPAGPSGGARLRVPPTQGTGGALMVLGGPSVPQAADRACGSFPRRPQHQHFPWLPGRDPPPRSESPRGPGHVQPGAWPRECRALLPVFGAAEARGSHPGSTSASLGGPARRPCRPQQGGTPTVSPTRTPSTGPEARQLPSHLPEEAAPTNAHFLPTHGRSQRRRFEG